AVAPLAAWRAFARGHLAALAGAGAAGLLLALAVAGAQASWTSLGFLTLHASELLLRLISDEVVIDPATRALGLGDFIVTVAPSCSGLEGVALITAFTLGYFHLFRDELRFPAALALLPLGVVVMWCLNAVRIAALIWIGEAVSPELALGGFHSQAGWLMFLIASFGVMSLAHGSGLFAKSAGAPCVPQAPPRDTDPGRLATALLAPFALMMFASVIAGAFATSHEWLYGLKVAAIAGGLIAFRRELAALIGRVSPLALLAGLAVAAAWIATEPRGGGAGAELGAWLESLSAPALLAWLALRFAGTALLVPIAEELAFRGYLHRRLIAREFETAAPGAFSWLALIVTAALFGAFHARWLSAALAGACYTLLLCRRGRLSDAVGAHMVTNAVIFAWAVAAEDWALL
ncbi:MAG: exosortase E/protease, VPEID-CTERM system, partial [Caulobacterales bacterium]|nr:exosortase E/protease, VPEID-CTERM system [Caulobacterales bacterium]